MIAYYIALAIIILIVVLIEWSDIRERNRKEVYIAYLECGIEELKRELHNEKNFRKWSDESLERQEKETQRWIDKYKNKEIDKAKRLENWQGTTLSTLRFFIMEQSYYDDPDKCEFDFYWNESDTPIRMTLKQAVDKYGYYSIVYDYDLWHEVINENYVWNGTIELGEMQVPVTPARPGAFMPTEKIPFAEEVVSKQYWGFKDGIYYEYGEETAPPQMENPIKNAPDKAHYVPFTEEADNTIAQWICPECGAPMTRETERIVFCDNPSCQRKQWRKDKLGGK